MLPPMKAAILAAGLALGALALAVPAASASPDTENTWDPADQRMRGIMDLGSDEFTAEMSSSGQGVLLAGAKYRDYDATSGTWGAWRRLHREADLVISGSNPSGDVCTAWNADFGAAFACRPVGGAWKKLNLSTKDGATPYDISVSSDGKRALIVWADFRSGELRSRATVYSFTSERASTVALSNVVALEYLSAAVRLAGREGFVILSRRGDEGSLGTSTYYRLFRPLRGWSDPQRLTLSGQDVLVSSIATDEAKTFLAASPVIPESPEAEPTTWWVAQLQSDGTFSLPREAGNSMLWPEVAASGASATLAGEHATNETLMVSTTSSFSMVPFSLEEIASPIVADTVGTLVNLDLVGQRNAEGRPGFALVAQYRGEYVPEEDWSGAWRLYSLVGFPSIVGPGLSSLTRLGTVSETETGMPAHLGGHGQYALVLYRGGGDNFYAGVRKPLP